jgi:hypothetical protein
MSSAYGLGLQAVATGLVTPESIQQIEKVGEAILQAWRDHAEELAKMEQERISGRIPVDTGTLDASLAYVTNPNPQTIAEIYTDPAVQLDGPWERVYAQYQEGLPLGVRTYTNPARNYVYDALTEDYAEIQAWAYKIAKQAVEEAQQEAEAEYGEIGGEEGGGGEGGGGE